MRIKSRQPIDLLSFFPSLFSSLRFQGLMATRFHKNPTEENHIAPLHHAEPVPDLADFMMNDWFYGTPVVKKDNMGSEVTSENRIRIKIKEEEDEEVIGTKGSSTGKLTQEWLEEAKRMVADSPSRHASPSRLGGSPRFASSRAREPSPMIERRDPLSRSARRHRVTESVSNDIILKTAARASVSSSPTEKSPASVVHQWFSNILNTPTPQPDTKPLTQPPLDSLPPKLHKTPRKSRFQQQQDSPPPSLPLPPKRTFRDASPAREPPPPVLSPPRNLVESAHRRSISSSTCSLDGAAAAPRRPSISFSEPAGDDAKQINSFLKRQRSAIKRISSGEVSAKAKIILSGSSSANSTTSSIVAAICYAWLLENGEKKENVVVVPVVNIRRGKMWKQRQAAWLFYHLGIDASELLFADEVDLDGLIMSRQLSIVITGQDVLKTNGEVGSICTVLTDNYCEDAYNLLQAPNLKKLLLAGILLDTQNLNSSAKFFTNRDAEAVQLLLVGDSSNYRYELFEQLMRDHRSNLFLEAMRNNYGKPSSEAVDKEENGVSQEPRLSTRKSTSISPKEAKTPASTNHKPPPAAAPEAAPTPEAAPRGKNKNFFAKLFGFGSK